MADNPVTDPEVLEALDKAPSDKPVSDPKVLEELEGSEPSIGERLFKGATTLGRGAAEYVAPLVPKGPKEAEAGLPASAKPVQGRLKQRKVEDDWPIVGDPVEFAGSMIGPGALAKGITKLAPQVPKVLQGGIIGALTGALEPTGKTITDPGFAEEKTAQVGSGAAFGFGFTLGGKAVSAGLRTAGDWLLKQHPDMVMSKAVQTVLNQISRDEKYKGMSAKSAIDLVEATQSGMVESRSVPGTKVAIGQKKPMVLADIANIEDNPPQTGVQKLAKDVARTPEGQQIALAELKARDKATPDRINAEVGEYISSGPTAYEAEKVLTNHQIETAKPLYEATDKLQHIYSDHLNNTLLNLPDLKQGMKAGYHSERIHAAIRREPFDPTMLGIELDVDGNIKFLKIPNMRVLDMGKRGLDAMIELERDASGKLTSRGRDLVMLKNDYVAEIDSLDRNGVYKKARAAWAGPAASKDAIKLGRALFNLGPEEAEAIFRKMGPSEQEHMRIGLADVIKERIGKTGMKGDEAQAIIKNPWMQKQLRPLLKTEADFNDFINSITKEAEFFETFKQVKSAGRQEETKGISDTIKSRALEMGQQFTFGHWMRGIGNFYRMHRDLGMRTDPKMNEALAKVLFSPEGVGMLKSPPAAPKGRLHSAAEKASDFSPYLATLAPNSADEAANLEQQQ